MTTQKEKKRKNYREKTKNITTNNHEYPYDTFEKDDL